MINRPISFANLSYLSLTNTQLVLRLPEESTFPKFETLEKFNKNVILRLAEEKLKVLPFEKVEPLLEKFKIKMKTHQLTKMKNTEREHRIDYEIIVDCYDEEEQKMGWYYYMEGKLHFPFEAQIILRKRMELKQNRMWRCFNYHRMKHSEKI